MSNLADFLLARIAEDEVWATEASRHDDEPIVPGGEHWRWECREHDVEVVPDPGAGEFMLHGDEWAMSLRSVEQYPFRNSPMLGVGPSIHLSPESELAPAVAGHIARHDPARVLAECTAKRRIVELHRYGGTVECDYEGDDCPTLRLLALPYADHPDYREEWRLG